MTAVLIPLIMAIGCTSPGPPEQSLAPAAEEFGTATDSMLALASFRIVITADGEPSGSVDYVAPDSARRVIGSAGEGIETISIGSMAWFSIPERPGYYYEGNGGDVEDVLLPLALARSGTDVARTGPGAFSFSSKLGEISVMGTAVVADGLIRSVTLSGLAPDVESVTFRFSAYDSGRDVEPPPGDRIVEQPGLPPCGEPPVAPEICVEPKETTS